jgi:hypothetical protein
MKRYISAVLNPFFLLQLFGCHSLKESTLEELLIKKEGTISTKDEVSVESISFVKTSLLLMLGLGIIFMMALSASLASSLDSSFKSCEAQK